MRRQSLRTCLPGWVTMTSAGALWSGPKGLTPSPEPCSPWASSCLTSSTGSPTKCCGTRTCWLHCDGTGMIKTLDETFNSPHWSSDRLRVLSWARPDVMWLHVQCPKGKSMNMNMEESTAFSTFLMHSRTCTFYWHCCDAQCECVCTNVVSWIPTHRFSGNIFVRMVMCSFTCIVLQPFLTRPVFLCFHTHFPGAMTNRCLITETNKQDITKSKAPSDRNNSALHLVSRLHRPDKHNTQGVIQWHLI